MNTLNNLLPRMKHKALKYHHFWRFFEQKIIAIKHVCTNKQMASIFNNPIDDPTLFRYLIWKYC